jgi:hypothetical protein
MTAINFPDTPAPDEEFTAAGRTFVWNDTLDVWESVSETGANLDGGTPSSNYGGIETLDAGGV